MKCYNRNSGEYQQLYKKYGSYLKTDMLIDEYQAVNKTDIIPTVQDVTQLEKTKKTQFSLKKKELSKAIIANLRNKGHIRKRNGQWWIVSNKQYGYNDYDFDPATFRRNAEAIKAYLRLWNIPKEFLILEFGTRKKYRGYDNNHPSLRAAEIIQWGRIEFDKDALTLEDTLPEMRSKNTTHINMLLEHLKKVFPQIGMDIVSVAEAKEYYESLPASQQMVPFAQIKSYIYDGRAKIIKGRVTAETAVEEVLHPFINALMMENPGLTKSLLKEAEESFPALAQEIMEAYSDKRGFTNRDRQNELITQALSRHFNKEFEGKPTKGWKEKILELLQWLAKHISDIWKYVSGNELVLTAGMINEKTSMSDLAKLLNTGDLQFKLDERAIKNDGKIQFKLSKRLQDVLDKKFASATDAQNKTKDKLFHQAKEKKEELDILSVTGVNPVDGTKTPLTILDKGLDGKQHVYRDIATGDIGQSVTSLIGGEFVQEYPVGPNETLDDVLNTHGLKIEELMLANKMSEQQLKQAFKKGKNKIGRIQIPKGNQYTINREIGEDFDNIMNGLAEGLTWDEIKEDMTFERVPEALAEKFYNQVLDLLYNEVTSTPNWFSRGAIVVPQVVVSNRINTGKLNSQGQPIHRLVAGTIDLLVINEDGSVFPVDLKTSWTSIDDAAYNKGYPVGPGSILYDPSKSQSEQEKLSKRQRHSAQVNVYGRLLENSGYDVRGKQTNAELRAITFHFKVTLDKNNEQLVDYDYDGSNNHIPGHFDDIAKKIVPIQVDKKRQKQVQSEGVDQYLEEEDNSQQLAEEEIIASDTYQAIFEVVDQFQQHLISRRKAVDKLREAVKLMGTKAQEIEKIDFTISAITLAMRDAKVDVLYTELLRDAIEQLDSFLEYIDPARGNATNPEFISKVINFQRSLEGFQGLTKLTKNEGLNNEQLRLKDTLQTKLTELADGGDSKINLAIDDYVRTLVRNESSRDFDDMDLDLLMKRGQDIGMAIYYTGDMATQRDTLLALMDKIYKRQRQKVIDAVILRNMAIKKAASKLEKLTGGKVDYSFMLSFDPEGNFTGRYIKEVGRTYYDKLTKLREQLTDVDGVWKEYIYNADTSWYGTKEGQEALKRNKEIHAARRELRKFMEPETVVDGVPQDGSNHRYTAEFKEARAKYQVFKPYKGGKGGRWTKADGISKEEYQQFLLKYYDTVDYSRAIYDQQGDFTGMIQPDSDYFPKREFTEIRTDSTIDGKSIKDEKYVKLMETDPAAMTELEKAQREFYMMYIEHFENDLLQKLPPSVMDQMIGRVPTIKDNLYNDLKKKGPFFVRLWAKMQRSVKNFFQTTSISKKVTTDENGNIINTLPIYYVGKPRTEKELADIEDAINKLDVEYKALEDPKPKDEDAYRTKRGELIEKRMSLQTRPTVNELQMDIADSLMRFSHMAENYEIMGEIEDTLHAMLKVVKQRQYTPASGEKLRSMIGGVMKTVGRRATDDLDDPLIVQRAKKWMKMVYYDNDKTTKDMFDKLADALISYTSLTYVGFNPFGNFNNYLVGRMSNFIETSGGMYYDSRAGVRATMEFNKRAIPDFMKAIGHRTFLTEKLGMAAGQYEDYIPQSKYEAMVDYFRMMDAKADIRETIGNKGKDGGWERFKGWGYMIQDAAEYNVQTKVGMAILMTTRAVKLNEDGTIAEDMSLFDALDNDPQTGEVKLKDGFTHIQEYRNGKLRTRKNEAGEEVARLREWNENTRYDIRNNIREVNKQIHGNYAYEDRTIMQTMALGRLAMQFHKWVAPTIKARFRPEYYDENLGWVEGRYLTGWSFMKYAVTNLREGRNILTNWKAQQGAKGEYRVRNLKRNIGDIAVVLASIFLKIILTAMLKGGDADDDESALQRKLENVLLYQLDRQKQEFMMFWPILGAEELFKLSKSPFSSLRTLEELAEAGGYTFSTISLGLTKSKEEFLADKRVVYQRGSRAGQWKINKNWMDAVPLLYAFEKWKKYMDQNSFHVK